MRSQRVGHNSATFIFTFFLYKLMKEFLEVSHSKDELLEVYLLPDFPISNCQDATGQFFPLTALERGRQLSAGPL